ncbi:hypothetical protein NECAME_00948 [Necator americanus]|uniref:Uncharacterized protein n=1 Tax=Necator americanus TaxID=51031 RepID=W2SMQ8_NECAM|nr:hypothetical protein NECAME_00948 [Necator americanus]ETN70002.1 hypothetical protein NECAME_00948 [Necator americanus]
MNFTALLAFLLSLLTLGAGRIARYGEKQNSRRPKMFERFGDLSSMVKTMDGIQWSRFG